MAGDDDSEPEVLSELDTGLEDLPAHVGTKAGLPGGGRKHDVLVRAEQRCAEPSCPSKTLQLVRTVHSGRVRTCLKHVFDYLL
jgi:hypothetical protein